MKNFRITYRPFAGATLESDDVVLPAEDELDARAQFERHFTAYFFVSAKEE